MKNFKFIKNINLIIKNNIYLISFLLIILVWVFGINSNNKPKASNLVPSSNNESLAISSPKIKRSYQKNNKRSFLANSASRDNIRNYSLTDASQPISNSSQSSSNTENKKITKSATLTIKVKDTKKSKPEIEKIIKSLNGFITNFRSSNHTSNNVSQYIKIKIPSKNLDKAIEKISSLGEKKYETFSLNDITMQYSDNEARLKNLIIRRDRLRKMMNRDTKSLSHVLSVDRELSSVQYSIDSLDRRQRLNDHNVAYSTINLTIHTEARIGDTKDPGWSFYKSWKDSINKMISSFHLIIDKIILLLVYTPIIIPPVLILIWIIKKFLISKKTKPLT